MWIDRRRGEGCALACSLRGLTRARLPVSSRASCACERDIDGDHEGAVDSETQSPVVVSTVQHIPSTTNTVESTPDASMP